ncbi:hypothetical protein SAY86_021624 [Trapa natans]|uniref:GDSL esterase/lipase n=1 Tax=Trapa natans TaxID=22666 RepID=A0AAN7REX6_TRANT|nr:hypothetical protein SAY86_021624 [Trapa natans]
MKESKVALPKTKEGFVPRSCLCSGTRMLPPVMTTSQFGHGRSRMASPSLVYRPDVTLTAVYSPISLVSKCLNQPSYKYKNSFKKKSRASPNATAFDLDSCAAKYLGLKSPVAYRLRSITRSRWLKYGMNFATGGTGVFDTVFPGPNMTTQIDLFQQLIEMKAASISSGLNSSIALVALSGNDYPSYLARNGSISVKRWWFPVCNLWDAFLPYSQFRIPEMQLDIRPPHSSSQQHVEASSSKFENPLKPCCLGLSDGFICGSVDAATSNKMYTVCPNPKKAFFWDMEHPTQEGWRAVFDILKPSLQQVF